ncbi:MAG: X-Pro dipeptidyl-peptidase [Mucilaginibacter sp.]|nr:X-Pro dipeptidyl-peptidase [Mucilaginibacter sp.]
MKAFFSRIAIFTLLILKVSVVIAQQTKPDDKYNRQEVMIPMRDGVKLHTVIFTLKDQKENCLC